MSIRSSAARVARLKAATSFGYTETGDLVSPAGVTMRILGRSLAAIRLEDSEVRFEVEPMHREGERSGWYVYLRGADSWTGGAADGAAVDAAERAAMGSTISRAFADVSVPVSVELD